MQEISSGSAIESVLDGYITRRAPSLRSIGIALMLSEIREEDQQTIAWHGLRTAGLADEESTNLYIAGNDSGHPLNRVARSQVLHCGAPDLRYSGPFAAFHWSALPASQTNDHDPLRAILCGFAPEPLTDEQQRDLEMLASLLGAVLAGAEAALHQRRESDQLALLMHYAANPIILCDREGTIVAMNPPARNLFDIAIPPGDERADTMSHLAQNHAQLQEFLAGVQREPTDVHMGELILDDPNSQETIVMAVASTFVPDAIEGESGTVLVMHDMTRARELEQHRIHQQLFESEKLAATGRLAASIAHEINNPLEAIKNSLYLLVQQTPPDDPNHLFLELAQRETERVSRIIRQMLGVSRPSVAAAPINVNTLVQEALQLLEPQFRQGRITLTQQIDATLPRVNASADQLKQVFLNLLLNARDAMPNGGGLLVQTRLAHEGDAEFLAGRHVIVRIRDDGAGIPADVLPHVFEPFFSTKSDKQGTGLGLWVCKEIIQQHGGQILVRSMVGKGTTFLVALPFIGG